MVNKMNVVFGGWYQRTTLHLSEIHRFLLHGTSDLGLSKKKLTALRKGLGLKSVKRIVGYLEYLEIETNNGIIVKYFEDGLYILSKEGSNCEKLKNEIRDYFENKFSPTIGYLFSLGAPTPKILSNLKEVHPFVIERISRDPLNAKIDKSFGEVYLETKSKGIRVSKTPDNIIIDVAPSRKKILSNLTEVQIFFSDFKLQLHKYLDIHRKIWEEIDEVKERKFIEGKNIGEYKAKLDSYQKTVQLIRNRINQMNNYAKTRREISKKVRIDDELVDLFQYRFEDLFNTLEYIKEIWNMTLDYVNSAIRVLEGVSAKAGTKGLKSIQFLVGFGVVAGFMRYLGPQEIPDIALSGVLYIVGLGFVAIGIDKVMSWNNKRKKYRVGFVERDEKI